MYSRYPSVRLRILLPQRENAGRGDGKLVHAQTQERFGQRFVCGKLTADADGAARLMRAFDGLPDRAQNGRVVRVAERGQIRVLPVHGQQILRQIVRADGEEVDLARKLAAHEHGGRRLDHHADAVWAEAFAARNEHILRIGQRLLQPVQLVRAGSPSGT